MPNQRQHKDVLLFSEMAVNALDARGPRRASEAGGAGTDRTNGPSGEGVRRREPKGE